MIRIITSFFGAGLIPFAPGTWGSLAAVPVAWALHILGGPLLLLAATVAVFCGGWWTTGQFTAGLTDHDPSEIVIDEVAGMFIALLPVSFGAWYAGVEFIKLYPGIITAFLAFRLFDIWKPWLVGWADRMHTPLGVMLDDVIAGVFAALVVAILATVAHLVFV